MNFKNDLNLFEEEYKMNHTIEADEEENVQLHWLDRSFIMGDVYNDLEKGYLFPTNDTWYYEIFKILKSVKDEPNKKVKIYRAVPINVNVIQSGDWVTLSKEYAEQHLESNLEEGHIITSNVFAKDLVWDGNDITEYCYFENLPVWEELSEDTEEPAVEKDIYIEEPTGLPDYYAIYITEIININRFFELVSELDRNNLNFKIDPNKKIIFAFNDSINKIEYILNKRTEFEIEEKFN
jgi:hypothetical protein